MPAEVRVRRRRGSPFGGRAALARGSREGRFGKSTVSGTLARALARRARDVVALDSDTMPGMRRSLGTREAEVTRLMEAVERGEDGKWRLRKGFGPVRTVQRCTTAAPDGVRVLQLGKADAEDNLESIHGAVMAFHKIACELAGSPTARRWTIVGDLPPGRAIWPPASRPTLRVVVVVVEPTSQSVLAGRRCAWFAREPMGVPAFYVANSAPASSPTR